ncbi:MAG: hypothetical protein L0Y56_15715, partial [Nitrospira sp.]|nr:hypothetical protein [Nitrospira sp.]
VVLLLCAIWPLSYLSIYLRPHSRVLATQWIKTHIPPGQHLSCEHWDDCLPLGHQGIYQTVEFPLYGVDTPQKWIDMSTRLNQTDYLILTSNRLYGSIMTVPAKYPLTHRFYSLLFAGKLGFQKVAEFTSRPTLPLPFVSWCFTPPGVTYGKVALASQSCSPGLSFVDDYADETFTVYDHPKVIIFKKTASIDYNQLFR